MARPLRIEYEGACYHVTARGNERKRIFRSKSDFNRFRWYMLEAREKFGCVYHSYVLMTTHYHLLIETPGSNLSRAIQYLNSSYAAYYNLKRERSGHLFQGRYKSILVDRDAYFLELSRYLHLNPVRAKMVVKPEEYRQSSYRAYMGEAEDTLVTADFILGMFDVEKGDATRKYREFVEEGIGKELENPVEGAIGQSILGGEEFIKQALRRLKHEELGSVEIADRRAFPSRFEVDCILDTVSEHYHVTREEVLRERTGEYRRMAIYLLKKHTGLTNGAIGRLFNGISYSAVSQAYRRFAVRLSEQSALKEQLDSVNQAMSQVKG